MTEQRTDEEAWAIVQENLKLGYSLARRFHQHSHGQAQYEELESAAPLVLFKAAKGFDESKGFKFSTYAGAALWRGFINIQRKGINEEKKGRMWAEEQELSDEHVPSLDRHDIAELISDAKLTDIQYCSVIMHYVDGMTYKEIGAILGASEHGIKNAIAKSKQRLNDRLNVEDLAPLARTPHKSQRSKRVMQLPHDDKLPEAGPVKVTPGVRAFPAPSILDQTRDDPELQKLRNANRKRFEGDQRAMEDWYRQVSRKVDEE